MGVLDEAKAVFVSDLTDALGFQPPDGTALTFSDFGRLLTVKTTDGSEFEITDPEVLEKVMWSYKTFQRLQWVDPEEEKLWES